MGGKRNSRPAQSTNYIINIEKARWWFSSILWLVTVLIQYIYHRFCLVFVFMLFWSLDVVFSKPCLVEPDWQPGLLLDIVEARSVNVKHIHRRHNRNSWNNISSSYFTSNDLNRTTAVSFSSMLKMKSLTRFTKHSVRSYAHMTASAAFFESAFLICKYCTVL